MPVTVKVNVETWPTPIVVGPNALAIQVLTTHDGFGWVALCYSESGESGRIADAEQQCSTWLQEFSFAD